MRRARLNTGGYFSFTMLLAFMIAPIAQLVTIGTQLTEALAGLDRTTEIMNEREEDAEPSRTHSFGTINGDVEFKDVGLRIREGQAGAARHQL